MCVCVEVLISATLVSTQTHTHTHTCELILIGSNVGPSSVGLVHTWDPMSYASVLHTQYTRSEDPIDIEG